MICEICYKGIGDGVALFRQNAKGQIGIWRCTACNKKRIAPDVLEIVQAVQEAGKE